MKHNDEFVPENVEEQIEQISYSLHQEPLFSNAYMIQELHTFYKEDQRSAKRIWERLAPYVSEYEGAMLPILDEPETVNKSVEEKFPSREPEWRSSRKKFAPQLTLIAAIFCTSLIVGSLLFVLQMVHSSHISSSPPSASSHSFYITRGGEVSRIDLQTHKTIWHTIVPKFNPGDMGNLVVFHDTVYLSLTSYFYALNTSDGHIRWSNKGLHAYSLSFVDGLLYAQTALDYKEAFYVFNPTNGKVETTYFPPSDQQTWPGPAIVDGIMYSATPADLYAVTLINRRVVWHQHYFFGSSPRVLPIEVRGVKNGIVYVQATVNTSTKTYQIILAFDARTGKKLWQLNTDTEILAITDSMIYTTEGQNDLTSSAPLNAFDAYTGKLLWHKSINPSKIPAPTDWYSIIKILFDSDTLYVSYENKLSVGGVVALNARDGTQLWQANVNEEISDSPLGIQNGVLYTTSYNNNKNSAIDAFKVSNGSRLWHLPLQASYPWRVILG